MGCRSSDPQIDRGRPMSKSVTKSVRWTGSAPAPLGWKPLVDIFDALVGPDLHNLPEFPEVVGHVTVTWTDGTGNIHKLDRLEDLEEPYSGERTGRVVFRNTTGGEQGLLVYQPGDPRPRAEASLIAKPEGIEERLRLIEEAFPLPFDGSLIFLSWAGEVSMEVAAVLQSVLESRFPSATVFFSETSIDVGDDPMAKMFEEGLLKAQVLIAVLTRESAPRPWVVWETATVWAKGKLVVPVFVDLEPGDVPGPLSLKTQGVHLQSRVKMDRALRTIGVALSVPDPPALTDDEWKRLQGVAVQTPSLDTYDPAELPVQIDQSVAPISDGLHQGTLLGLRITSQVPLDNCKVLMTSIVGPPGEAVIPVPTRLYWYPSHESSSAIPQGATEVVALAKIGPLPPAAVIESPDQPLPWVLANGAWRVELQLTASGHGAQFITAAFRVLPVDGIPNQTLEWTELTIA
jgi:hypothetical protein